MGGKSSKVQASSSGQAGGGEEVEKHVQSRNGIIDVAEDTNANERDGSKKKHDSGRARRNWGIVKDRLPSFRDVASWDEDHVREGLEKYEHMGKYSDIFRVNHIDGSKLVKMDSGELEALGMTREDAVHLQNDLKMLRERETEDALGENQKRPAMTHESLLEENARLKGELEASRREKRALTKVDEESLAKKLQEMLFADLAKKNAQLLERQAEELHLSLLTKIKFEAQNQATATATATAVALESKTVKKRVSRSSKRRRGHKKRARAAAAAREPVAVVSKPHRTPAVLRKVPTSPVRSPVSRQSADGSRMGAEKAIESGEDDYANDSFDQEGGQLHDPLKEERVEILEPRAFIPPAPEQEDSLRDVQEEGQKSIQEEEKTEEEEEEEEEEFHIENIDDATAQLLRRSWELLGRDPDPLSSAAAGETYIDGLREMAGDSVPHQVEGHKGRSSRQSRGKRSGGRKKRGKRGKKGKAQKQARDVDTDASAGLAMDIVGGGDFQRKEEESSGDEHGEEMREEKPDASNEVTGMTLIQGKNDVEGAAAAVEGVGVPSTAEGEIVVQGGDGESPKAGRKDSEVKMGKAEWENEVARNILVLYKANMEAVREEKLEGQASKVRVETPDSERAADDHHHHLKGKKARGSRRKKKGRGSSSVPVLPSVKKAQGKPSSMMKLTTGSSTGKKHTPHPIWFSGSGNVRAVWDGLVVADEEDAQRAMQRLTSDFRLVGELETLEKQGKYFKYIALVEAIMQARSRIYERSESHWRLWRQLATTANVFGVKLVDEGKFAQALKMLKEAQRLIDVEEAGEGMSLPAFHRNELRAFVLDSMGYYYYRRCKFSASLQYAQKAMKIFVRLQHWQHCASTHLHIGAILSRLQRHDESIRAMGQVLRMVEDGRLEGGGSSAQKICLVAVTYHNIAVEQLLLSRVNEACVSSQNARRLARLSLSYSNKFVKNFEATHQLALVALSTQKDVRKQLRNKEQATLFMDLTKTLYE